MQGCQISVLGELMDHDATKRNKNFCRRYKLSGMLCFHWFDHVDITGQLECPFHRRGEGERLIEGVSNITEVETVACNTLFAEEV